MAGGLNSRQIAAPYEISDLQHRPGDTTVNLFTNSTVTTITIGGGSGLTTLSLNSGPSGFLGLGNTSSQAIQIGASDGPTHDNTPGVIFIQPADGAGAGSYIAIYGADANASQPGGFVDIRGGNGFATGDRAAGDLFIYGGGANGSTTAGPVYCEGGFGGATAPGGLFEIKGGSTTLAAALAGDATIDGGTALSAADNGRVLVGTVNARSVSIGRSGVVTTINGTLAAPVLGGHLTFSPDNTYDIGAAGATRPRDLHVGRHVVVGGEYQPIILSKTSVNLAATGTTNLYTVPTGRSLVVTDVIVRPTTATAAVGDSEAGIGVAAGEDDIFPSQPLTGLNLTTERFKFLSSGVAYVAQSTEVVKIGVDVADTGTALVADVYLIGYLI